MKKKEIKFYNFLNEIKPVNLISHNSSYFFKNNLYKNLYKKNNSLTTVKKDIKNIDNKNVFVDSDFESFKLLNNDIKNIFNLNLNFYENEKYDKINNNLSNKNINIENNYENNNDNKYKNLKEFLHEKIEIYKKRFLNFKINENSRHSPGQYNPNYNYIYKKISSPIFDKSLKRKSIFDEISLNNFQNKKIKIKKNYSNDIENSDLINNENKKKYKKNIINLKKKIANLSLVNKNNSDYLNINKNIENSRNLNNNKRNLFLNDSTKDTKEILNKNKSVDDLINFKEKELTLKEKVKIFLITSKKHEKEYNKFLILNPLYKNSPRKFNISFNKMLGRESNVFKDRFNNLNKYNPNFSTIFPRVQSTFFGEKIISKNKIKNNKKININIIKK